MAVEKKGRNPKSEKPVTCMETEKVGLICLSGICDASRKDEISDLFEAAVSRRTKPWYMAIDMEKATFLDSTILGLMLQWYKRIDSTGGVMGIFSANEKLREIFRMTRIDKFVSVFDDWQTCKVALGGPPDSEPDRTPDSASTGPGLRGEDRLKLRLESIRKTLSEGTPGDSSVRKLLSRLESCSRDIDLLDTMITLYADSLESLEEANRTLSRELEERRHLEKARMRALDMAHKANNLKNFFLATLGHEIKNSINCIMGFSKFLAKDFSTADDDKREACDYILESAMHIHSLVEEVSDVAAIEAGKVFIQHAPIELKGFISSLKHSVYEDASENGLTIETEFGGDLDLLLSDQVRLRQILTNLLINAVKFSSPGGAITFKALKFGNCVKFSIADQGPGIPEEQRKHVFEPFRQLKVMRSSRRGTGLGLTIAKNLAELLGGSIEVGQVEFGQGSIFTVTIPGLLESNPLKNCPGMICEDGSKCFGLADYEAVTLSLQSTNPACFVLAENEATLHWIESLLNSAGARVSIYRSESKARRQLAAGKMPHIGVIDLAGHGMGPRKLTSLLLKKKPGIRLVVIGAHPELREEWGSMGSPAPKFLPKSYHPLELLAAISDS